ncbi:MAG: hypothetical protein KGI41_03985 [Patescibacteria group bacterium]|nr:hypothetical protein [Patescibacteria group bacterium]MDE1966369.1 hypothetical protein [Patescibacteria group bacterium]
MIYLFAGSDAGKVRAKAFAWVAAARAKEPNLAYARLGKDEMNEEALAEAAFTGGLFVARLLVVLDDPFEAGAGESPAVEDALPALAASDNAIVIVAPKLSPARAKKLEALAVKSYVFDAPAKASRGFNVALVNALAARDGARLWVEVERALAAGDAPEMVHGLLHWKARDLMRKGSRAWSPSEARALSLSLIALLQESRASGIGLSEALERFALSL